MNNFHSHYPLKQRLLYSVLGMLGAVIIAGFWNYHLVDGFGKEIIMEGTLGNSADLADDYPVRGGGFGFLFAAFAGLAATFTACNCVVFAMIPGLACSVDTGNGKQDVWKTFRAFIYGVMSITAFYGIMIGLLGKEGVEVINERSIRLAQAQAVFSLLGIIMLLWGALEMGFLDAIKSRFSAATRQFFSQLAVKGALLGLLVGFFAVGRPFPVFREFLLYAASASNPFYGAAVMMVQGLGQIAVMALIFILVVKIAGEKIGRAAIEKPHTFKLTSALALISGGMYFVFYWGLAFLFDIGGWGFKLGWY